MIIRHQTKFIDRLSRKVGDRVMNDSGKLKNGYTLIIGLILGFLLGASL